MSEAFNSMKKEYTRGFTLLELLVTATLIAVLTVIGIVSYSSVNKRSRDVKRRSDLEQLRSALEMFRSDKTQYPGNASYPSIQDATFNDASTLGSSIVANNYIPSIPTDPDGKSSYYYEPSSSNNIYNGYCVCAMLEIIPSNAGTCTSVTLPGQCNYGLKNP